MDSFCRQYMCYMMNTNDLVSHRKCRLMSILQIMMKHRCQASSNLNAIQLFSCKPTRKEIIELTLTSNLYLPVNIVNKILNHPKIEIPKINSSTPFNCTASFQISPNDYMLMIDPMEVLNYAEDIRSYFQSYVDSQKSEEMKSRFLLFEYISIVQREWLSNVTMNVLWNISTVVNAKIRLKHTQLEKAYAMYDSVLSIINIVEDAILEIAVMAVLNVCNEETAECTTSMYQQLENTFLLISKSLQQLLMWSANPQPKIIKVLQRVKQNLLHDQQSIRLPLLAKLFEQCNPTSIMVPELHNRYTYQRLICRAIAYLKGRDLIRTPVLVDNSFKFWDALAEEYNNLSLVDVKSDMVHINQALEISHGNIQQLHHIYALSLIPEKVKQPLINMRILSILQEIHTLAFIGRNNSVMINLFEDILIWMKHTMNEDSLISNFYTAQRTWHFLDVAANPKSFDEYVIYFALCCYRHLLEECKLSHSCQNASSRIQRCHLKDAIMLATNVVNSMETRSHDGEHIEIKMLQMHCHYFLYSSDFSLPYIDQQHKLDKVLRLSEEWSRNYNYLVRKSNRYIGLDNQDHDLIDHFHCLTLKVNCFIQVVQVFSPSELPSDGSIDHLLDTNYLYADKLLHLSCKVDYQQLMVKLDWTRLRLLISYVKQVLNEVAFQWIAIQGKEDNWQDLHHRSGEMVRRFYPVLKSYQSLRKIFESSMSWAELEINREVTDLALIDALYNLSDEVIMTITADMQTLIGDAELMMLNYLDRINNKHE